MELTGYDLNAWHTLPIVKFPNPILNTPTEPVTAFDDELKELVNQMLTTMYLEPGCGLSANQVGVSKSVFVTDTDYESETNNNGERTFSNLKPRVFINPILKNTEGEQICEEGCLSFPGLLVDVKRHKNLVIEFQGINGETMQLEASDFFADCLQHEYDHLQGVTFLDYMGYTQKQMTTKKYLKSRKK